MTTKSAAVKRLMKESSELTLNPCHEFTASPLESNIFEWHFTLRGPPNCAFAGGRYHGRIIFPTEYPFKPPNIEFLTPNGRFEVGKKICLSITGYHPESWRPAWGVRTAIVAIISFFPTSGDGAVGALDWCDEDRKKTAVASKSWKCSACGSCNSDALQDEEVAPSIKLEVDPEIELKGKSSIVSSKLENHNLPLDDQSVVDLVNDTLKDAVAELKLEAAGSAPKQDPSTPLDPKPKVIPLTREQLDRKSLVYKIDVIILVMMSAFLLVMWKI